MRRTIRAALGVLVAVPLAVGGAATSAWASGEGDPARGTVKIEETELSDGDTPNEVKAGCDFSVEFFGMAAGEVPLTFTLVPPSGDRVIARATARVEEAQGNDPSGSLDVDLAAELAGVPPAQAEDYDYKVRVDAEVKSTAGNESITKSAILFLVCDSAVGGVGGAGEEGAVPVGGVAAGGGGTAGSGLGGAGVPLLGAAAGLMLLTAWAAGRRRRA